MPLARWRRRLRIAFPVVGLSFLCWMTWIRGANHAQFGFYGRQLGDCSAQVTRQEQLVSTRSLIDSFVRTLPHR